MCNWYLSALTKIVWYIKLLLMSRYEKITVWYMSLLSWKLKILIILTDLHIWQASSPCQPRVARSLQIRSRQESWRDNLDSLVGHGWLHFWYNHLPLLHAASTSHPGPCIQRHRMLFECLHHHMVHSTQVPLNRLSPCAPSADQMVVKVYLSIQNERIQSTEMKYIIFIARRPIIICAAANIKL